MTRTRSLLCLTLLVILFLPASSLLAQNPPPPPPGGGPGGGRRGPGPGFMLLGPEGLGLPPQIMRALQLDPSQRQQIQALVKSTMQGQYGTEIKSLHEATHALELAIWNPSTAPGAIETDQQTIDGLEAQIAVLRQQFAQSFEKILTSQQISTLETMLTAPPHPGGRRSGRDGGNGGGNGGGGTQ